VFIDFRRVFETINREKLLTKLHQCGIRDKVLEWFGSYLDGRTQRVGLESE